MGGCYISKSLTRWKNGTRTTGLYELWHRDTRCCCETCYAATEFYKHPLEKIYI